MTQIACSSTEDAKNVAERLTSLAKPGRCFALFGDLGSGKTTFAKYFIESLSRSSQDVTSPTFTIVQIYDSDIAEIWHADFYRLKSEEEFYELGFEEALSRCITIIEWPEIVLHLLPHDTVKINFRCLEAKYFIEIADQYGLQEFFGENK
jgi:tRNA threonylcarbamoyladenosine biosynthesis protein TsaE